MLLKVDKMKKLLRKSPWKWSLVNRGKKRGKKREERKEASKLLMVFIFNFPFICYLARIYK